MRDSQTLGLHIEGETADRAWMLEDFRRRIAGPPNMSGATRRTGVVIGSGGDAVDPSCAKTSQFFYRPIGGYAQKPAIVAPGEDGARCPVGGETQDRAPMGRDRYRRRVGTKKPDHTVPKARRHTRANRKGGGYRSAHIKGQTLPLKLGPGDALAL